MFCTCYCNRYLPTWVQLWLVVSAVICAGDVFYTLMRPDTLRGGAMEEAMMPWHIYSDVDLRYNSTTDPVTNATQRLMVAEIVLNVVAVLLCWMPCAFAANSTVIAFTSSCMTFWKTLLYLNLYILPPPGSPSYLVDPSSLKTIGVFWVMDSIWVVLPLLVMLRLWPKLTNSVAANSLILKQDYRYVDDNPY